MYKAGKNCGNKNLCSVSILTDKVEKKGYSIFNVSNEKERLKNKALKVDVVIAMGICKIGRWYKNNWICLSSESRKIGSELKRREEKKTGGACHQGLATGTWRYCWCKTSWREKRARTTEKVNFRSWGGWGVGLMSWTRVQSQKRCHRREVKKYRLSRFRRYGWFV